MTAKNKAAVIIGNGQRTAVYAILGFELTFEVCCPQNVRLVRIGQRPTGVNKRRTTAVMSNEAVSLDYATGGGACRQ